MSIAGPARLAGGWFTAVMVGLSVLSVSGCSGGKDTANSKNVAEMDGPLFAQTPADWAVHGGNAAEQRFSPLDRIDTANVSELGLAWTTQFDTNRGQEATPLVIGGTVYLSTAWSKVIALDGKTGQAKWHYDPEIAGSKAREGCCDVVNRGVAYADGVVFLGAFDGRLVALDAKTGKPIWQVQTTDTAKPYTITGAPRIARQLVLIGNGGAELGVRGYVSAYDRRTGQLKWRFYTVPNPQGQPDGAISDEPLFKLANNTWNDGEWRKTGGGGTVWDAIVYDPELNQVLIGVGNGTPWSHQLRSGGKGDNLFLSSIVALDADTGRYRWHYQETPAENWDFTATQPIILANLRIGGRVRKVAMQAPKNGFFYVLDRENGEMISADPFVEVNWASGIDPKTGRPIETKVARYGIEGSLTRPSAFGAHNWYPMSFSPKTGLVYFPVQEIGMIYAIDGKHTYRERTFNTGVHSDLNIPPDDQTAVEQIRKSLKGALIAWDPVARKEVWRARQPGPASGGTLATAGNLVFEGNLQGTFRAFAADSGKELWHFQAETAVQGSPISYEIAGEQYVLVLSGYGGGFGLSTAFGDGRARNRPFGRALAFKIGGKAKWRPEQEVPVGDPTPVSDSFTVASIAEGKRVYETTCAWCHGAGAQSSGLAPDLRRSTALADKAIWQKVVIDGAMSHGGMASFDDILSRQQANAARGYVAQRAVALARQAKKP